ncbi:MAG: beta-N-acetylhexosaminidase [Brevundimonas sp.]|uniref:beta-N-acetylhexosaminidase n=1 Tax=Brevundimonas sp. TaxID=1871086 RepID=UPI00274AAD8B|nr:beta-N-acetylhexosaminidase [Brevundimonas sp.]MDP3400482.1 beta-N-acetylhexosaminidase [Brevundimonas sp.]MDZ4112091.1 beta-N-acetylhexosaminidase [Brevundimonas sp.]
MTRAIILGCSGPRLTPAEAEFFAEAQPFGFILFRRNVEDPAQLAELVAALRACVEHEAPVLIDQEGGRVQRMVPPHWTRYPPGAAYLKSSNELAGARETARLGARLMAHDLHAVGIDVDCLPVLDVPMPGAHDIIGDRAYAADPEQVAVLGRAAAEGLMAGGVLPVIKHIPGHGRALADSHHDLPVVNADRAHLEAWDFMPFRALSDMPIAMTAHVVYTALDPEEPATTSRIVLDMVRDELGYQGLIVSDDLSMKALKGDFEQRAKRALKAGCDVVLHCNGDMAEMQAVLAGSKPLKGKRRKRAEAAMARRVQLAEPLDVMEGRARFDRMMAPWLEAKAGPDVGEAQG